MLCIGGAPELPGAIVLAGTAALRAGAGKLQIGTCRSIAPAVGLAIPECLAVALPMSRAGGIAASAAQHIAEMAGRVQALLVGPGMVDQQAIDALMAALLRRLAASHSPPVLVLDAAAMQGAHAAGRDALSGLGGRVVMTPHAGEMAQLLGMAKDTVEADPLQTALTAAMEIGAIVALKGSETIVATPEGDAYCYREGSVGLATSGSGDTLAGIVAGLAARGAEPVQAASWGVYLHGAAGNCLTRRMGPLGFLARELLAEVPALMASFSSDPT